MFKTEHFKEQIKGNLTLLIALVGLLVISRLLPHWPNVTALGALTILAPRWFRNNKLILIIPLVALLVSDAIIGFHSTMIYTYLSVFLVSWISLKAPMNRWNKTADMIFSGFAASVLFYVITNFGAWLALELYSKSIAGLLLSYWNALPFFGYEFMGTLFYMGMSVAIRNLVVKNLGAKAPSHSAC